MIGLEGLRAAIAMDALTAGRPPIGDPPPDEDDEDEGGDEDEDEEEGQDEDEDAP